MNLRHAVPTLVLLPLLAACSGNILESTIEGQLEVDGEMPANFTFEIYSYTNNTDAFDASFCNEVDEAKLDGDCYGRVKLKQLKTPSSIELAEVDGNSFTLSGVPTDLAYILVVTGDDDSVVCSTDVVGFQEETKVVTSNSAIAIDLEGGLNSFTLPRPVRLSCAAPSAEPVAPEAPEPIEPGDPDSIDDDGDIQAPPVVEWTSFTVTRKGGSPILADASDASVVADQTCGPDFPAVIEVNGTVENAGDSAWLRIQFGSGDDATYRTIQVPVVDGRVNQAISLTGGYSVLQLDTNEELDGEGESYTVTFCDRGDLPAQELLLILSWDKDDTDVDLHVLSQGQEVAYYSMSQSWGDLDIDDINGFGPETFTSTPETSGRQYDVRLHYYSDHGNGNTTATLRAVYVDPNGQVCDITTSKNMRSYEWWDVASFGPGMDCPK